ARDASGWHGLGAAACVAAVLGSILLLAWPGLLPAPARWAVAAAAVPAWPLLHVLLQRLPAPPPLARAIPGGGMEGEATPPAPRVSAAPAAAAPAGRLLGVRGQRRPAAPSRARVIPGEDREGEATLPPPPAPAGDLDRALYAAAPAGRVDQALALVEAGGDVH